jgi:hypothetical protein
MKSLVMFSFLVTIISFTGCLVGHKIVYIVDANKNGPGTATVWWTDIRSDASNDYEFGLDKDTLFNYILKSDDFIKDMKAEGKSITSRELTINNGRLDGKAVYYFERLNDVENLAFEDGFYYLTLALDDSVISTNGELIKSSNYKRILWDQSINPLKFEILIEPAKETKTRPLAQYYKKEMD